MIIESKAGSRLITRGRRDARLGFARSNQQTRNLNFVFLYQADNTVWRYSTCDLVRTANIRRAARFGHFVRLA